jgi:hypothetical protein
VHTDANLAPYVARNISVLIEPGSNAIAANGDGKSNANDRVNPSSAHFDDTSGAIYQLHSISVSCLHGPVIWWEGEREVIPWGMMTFDRW